MRAHGTQHKSCPRYKGAGSWFEGQMKKRKDQFKNNGLQYDLFGQKDGEWTYKGANLCVGYGGHNKKCDSSKLYCSGKNKNGTGDNQIKSIIEAAKNLNKNGRPHPKCPITEYGMETIKSDKEILGLGNKNIVNFQFRRDGRLQMFKQGDNKDGLYCVEQTIDKKCRTSKYANAMLCNDGEYCDTSGKDGNKCCDTKGGKNKCARGYNMCNNDKCNKAVEEFISNNQPIIEDFNIKRLKRSISKSKNKYNKLESKLVSLNLKYNSLNKIKKAVDQKLKAKINAYNKLNKSKKSVDQKAEQVGI